MSKNEESAYREVAQEISFVSSGSLQLQQLRGFPVHHQPGQHGWLWWRGQACIPDEVPNTSEVVPAGLTQVVLAAGLIPKTLARFLFTLFTILAASTKSSSNTLSAAIPVMDTPINASFSVVLCHISLR